MRGLKSGGRALRSGMPEWRARNHGRTEYARRNHARSHHYLSTLDMLDGVLLDLGSSGHASHATTRVELRTACEKLRDELLLCGRDAERGEACGAEGVHRAPRKSQGQ